nr:kinesin-like protein KIF14 isoform X2 [Halyomorpha halys]
MPVNTNFASLSKTIEKAQKNIIKTQVVSPHSSEENLKPLGTPLSHLKSKERERPVNINKTPLMSQNKTNRSPQNNVVTRSATPKSVQSNSHGTPKKRVVGNLTTSTPSKVTVKTTPKKVKCVQKSPSKYATPIKNETNILFQFSNDVLSLPIEESNPSFNEGFMESGNIMERLNRSYSASSILRLKRRCDDSSKIKRSLSEAKLSLQSSCSDYEGEKSQITVGVRVRPLLPREGMNGVNVNDGSVVVASDLGSEFTFSYEHCFPPSCSQSEVYESLVRPLLDNAVQGYNACLFAYGQTGSGKTYSMMGPNLEEDNFELTSESGMIPRFCKELLQKTSSLEEGSPSLTTSVEVSYLEVYNEKIHDLLVPGNTQLRVREHPVHGPYVVDLSRHTIKSFSDFQHWINVGNKKRSTAMTELNDKSSRSHSLFTILLTQTFAQVRSDGTWSHDQTRTSHINLVDLAGSERIASSTVSSDRLREGASINRSLLTLGKVMSALVDNRGFVPYRESVLTWLLKESLGGNSRTCMLATVSPCSTHLDETMSTLRYASQARAIVNRVRVNEAPQDREMRELREELERLRPAGERINTLLSEKEDLEDQLKLKTDEIINLETEIEKYKSLLSELSKSKDELMENISNGDSMKQELVIKKQLVLELEQNLEATKKELSNIGKFKNDLEKELENRRQIEINDKDKINKLKKDIKTLKNEVMLSKSDLTNALRSKETLEEQLSEKSFRVNELSVHQERISILEEELENLKKKCDKTEVLLKEAKQTELALENKLNESNLREEKLLQNAEQIPALESALNDLEKELRKARSDLSESKKYKDELTKQLQNSCLKEEIMQLKEVNNKKIEGLEDELQKYKTELVKCNEENAELNKKLSEISSREELLKMEADKVPNLESELRLLEAESRISKREFEAVQSEKESLVKELKELRTSKEEFNKLLVKKDSAQDSELKKILEELSQTKTELKRLEKVIEELGYNLNESHKKEEQLLLKLQNLSVLEKELKKLTEELIPYKEAAESRSQDNVEEDKINTYVKQIENMDSEISRVKGQLLAEQKAKEELKKKLVDASTTAERMKFKADQAIRTEIELEKVKNELNEERKNTSELLIKISDYKSREDVLKAEICTKAQHLENAQVQLERQQQVQVTLMEEKLTLLKVMEKQCSAKESKHTNDGLIEENAILKKEVAVLNERLSNSSKENVELRKRLMDSENLLRRTIEAEGKKEKALAAALENRDKEMYEFIMDSAFPHHLVYLVRKARTFTEIYKIPYEFELGEKTITMRHLMLNAKAVLNHLKLSKWIERIENEKTWYKSMDCDLPWEVDFGDYYDRNDAHKIILEDPRDNKNCSINIGTKVTASGCLNPILWRKTMIRRHVMGLKEDSDVLIKYFNEVEDSRVYSILTRIQVSVARLEEATYNVEK